MDKNEDVSKELIAHTAKLSTCLEHFKKNFGTENGDHLAIYIDKLHKCVGDILGNDQVSENGSSLARELECVQNKVNQWNSSGRLQKAFLSSDHAEELKIHQDTVQNALEEMQVRAALFSVSRLT